MLKKILLALLVLVIGLVILVALQPSQYSVQRKATMAAPPAAVFEQVNDVHKFQAWSPWSKKDPAMKMTYDGPAAGKGANFSWVGNSDVGEGKMTIVESQPAELVKYKLEFFKPFAGEAEAEFAFQAEGQGTVVQWSMKGENNFVGKAMCLVMNMDQMIGGDFETGLASLKQLVEAGGKK